MKKKRMMRVMALLTAAALCVVPLAGCGGNSTEESVETKEAGAGETAGMEAENGNAAAQEASGDDGRAGYRDELHIVIGTEPTNLDVVMNTATVAVQVAYGTIFESLVTMDENYEPIPELCESWTISDDCMEYHWKLREGVLFHNGEEMTAEDVAASMNRWLANAGNAQTMIGDAQFTAEDTYDVALKMDVPCAYVNELLAGLGQRAVIMPKSVLDSVDETGIVTEYIGTGPYKFVEWKAQQNIHITRNDMYQPYGTQGDFSGWGGYKEAPTKDIYFDVVTDESTVVAGMQTGEYDATLDITSDNITFFEDNEDFTVTGQECEMAFLIFNKKEGLGANQAMRQAVQAVINAEEVMQGVYGGAEMYSLYSSYCFDSIPEWYTEEGSEYYNQGSVENAAAYLEEAGYTPDQTFRILVASDDPAFYNMAIIVQNQLQNAGISCEILSYDWSTFVSVRNDQPENYDAFITSFSPKILPTMNLYLSSTWAGWVSDEKILQDLSAISTETDREQAVKTWTELQKYMYEESVPVVKFGSNKMYMVASSKVEGIRMFEHIIFTNAKVAE